MNVRHNLSAFTKDNRRFYRTRYEMPQYKLVVRSIMIRASEVITRNVNREVEIEPYHRTRGGAEKGRNHRVFSHHPHHLDHHVGNSNRATYRSRRNGNSLCCSHRRYHSKQGSEDQVGRLDHECWRKSGARPTKEERTFKKGHIGQDKSTKRTRFARPRARKRLGRNTNLTKSISFYSKPQEVPRETPLPKRIPRYTSPQKGMSSPSRSDIPASTGCATSERRCLPDSDPDTGGPLGRPPNPQPLLGGSAVT